MMQAIATPSLLQPANVRDHHLRLLVLRRRCTARFDAAASSAHARTRGPDAEVLGLGIEASRAGPGKTKEAAFCNRLDPNTNTL